MNIVEPVTNPNSDTTTFTYDPTHPTWRTTTAYPSGVEQRATYDDGGRLASIEGWNTNPAPDIELTSFSYDYTGTANTTVNMGNTDTALRQKVTDVNGTVTTYGYDAADRLLSADSDPASGPNSLLEWTYDAVGNNLLRKLNSSTTNTYTYNDANELTTGGATFDANGNRTASSAYGYTAATYNAINQTVSQTPNGGSSQSMEYGGLTQDHLRTLDSTQYETAGSVGTVGIYDTSDTYQLDREPGGRLVDELQRHHLQLPLRRPRLRRRTH